MTATVYLNGQYLPKDEARISPDDRGFLFGDGVYEVVVSYDGGFFRMSEHMERLADGLRSLRIPDVDTDQLAATARELLLRNKMDTGNAAVYFQVTRGAAPRKHFFPDPPVPPTVYATAMPLTIKGDPAVGIKVITVPDTRWTCCDIKSIGLLANCLAQQQAREADAGEAVLIRDGIALEGTATSFFVVTDGVVRTAPNSNYILPGITRRVVLQICSEHSIPTRVEPVPLSDLKTADEMFMTGTTSEVLPVVQVDDRIISDGKPGPVSRRLVGLFQTLSRTEAEATVPVETR